ncbi:hypothetical protein K3495_g5982 [Podosphaera aphanis]|nr:hypothetical protein K3495_g5982 [Podosphaera aphanis]
MTADKVEIIQNTTKCDIRPRQILNEFRSQSKIQGTELILKLKDIYDTKRVLRATELKNNTPTQVLVLVLRERHSWSHTLETNSVTSRITRLFLAHVPTARELLANNCQIIMLECTYKTNRYKMPLLNNVGQTCLGTSFNIGSCFLFAETQADYEWALKTGLQSLFTMPHLPSPAVWVIDRKIALIRAIQSLHSGTSIVFCVWYINMDVRGYASKLLKQIELVKDLIKDMENVVYSNAAINYMDNRKKFEDQYTLPVVSLILKVEKFFTSHYVDISHTMSLY